MPIDSDLGKGFGIEGKPSSFRHANFGSAIGAASV